MTLERSPRAIGFIFRIKMQNNACDFTPVRTFRVRVEQAKIGDDVLLVVNGQRGIRGRGTATSGSSGGFCMGVLATLSIPPTLLGAPRHIDDGGSRQHQREDNRRAVSCAWHRYGTVGHIGS